MCTWDIEDSSGFKNSTRTVGTRIVVGYSRADGSITDLPSDEVVLEVIKHALNRLEVAPGWTVSFVGN